MIRRSIPWTQQPQVPVQLNTQHWLVQKGVVFYSPAPGVALSSKGSVSLLSRAMPDSPDSKMGRTVVGNATNYDSYAINLPGSTPFTLIAWGNAVDITNDHILCGVGTAGSNDHRACISMDGADGGGTDRVYAFCRDGTAGDTIWSAAGGYTANAWQMVTGVFGSATDLRVYLNNDKEGAQVSGVNIPTSAMTRLYVGSIPAVSPGALRTGDRVHGVVCVLGALTAAEVSRFYYEQLVNPWGLLTPQTRNIYTTSAAGGDVTIALSGAGMTSAAGAFSVASTIAAAGTAITSSTGSLSPETGAALSGNYSTFSVGTVGVQTGNDVTIALAGIGIVASAGSLAPGMSAVMSGSGVTVSAGLALPEFNRPLTGDISTFALGTLNPVQAIGATGSGFDALTGTLSVSYSIGLSGTSATFATGSLTVGEGSAITTTLYRSAGFTVAANYSASFTVSTSKTVRF